MLTIRARLAGAAVRIFEVEVRHVLEFVTASTPRQATLPNGIELEYIEQGDPGGIPVILLHGVTDSWWSWSRMMPHLPPGLRVFALSQRGHGLSSKPDSGYRQADMSTDVESFMDLMGLPAAVIVGHSMGGGVALRFATDRPGRVLGLGLVGTFVNMQQNAAVSELWATVATLSDPVDEAFVTEFQRSTLAQPVPDDFFARVVRESLKVPARVWRQAFAGFLESNQAPDLPRATCRTLIVWGDRDAIVPGAEQDVLVGGLRRSRLVVYRGVGHAPHWELPARVAQDIARACQTFISGGR